MSLDTDTEQEPILDDDDEVRVECKQCGHMCSAEPCQCELDPEGCQCEGC